MFIERLDKDSTVLDGPLRPIGKNVLFSQNEKRLVGGIEGVSILSTPSQACTKCWNRPFSSSTKIKLTTLVALRLDLCWWMVE